MTRRRDQPKLRRGNLEQQGRDRATRRRLRRSVGAVIAAGTVIATGAVTAAPLPAPDVPKQFGHTRTGPFADTTRAVITPDGWVIRAFIYAIDVRGVVPLGNSPQSWESFTSLTGKATIEPADPKNPPKTKVKAATISIGMILATPVTPQSLQISGNATNTVYGSVTPGLSATVGGSGTGGSSGGSGTGSVSVTPSISATVGDSLATGFTLTGNLAPGTSKDFQIGRRQLDGTSGYITSRETRAAIDGALGLQVRLYATASISTPLGDSSTTTYSNSMWVARDNPDPARKPPTVTVKEDPTPAPIPGQAAAKPATAAAAPPKPAAPAATPKPAQSGR